MGLPCTKMRINCGAENGIFLHVILSDANRCIRIDSNMLLTSPKIHSQLRILANGVTPFSVSAKATPIARSLETSTEQGMFSITS